MIPLMMLLASDDIQHPCQWCHMTKESFCTSFQLSWPKEHNGAIDDTIGITWHWCQHHVLAYGMQWWHWWCRSIMWHWCQCQGIKWPESNVAPHFDCLDQSTAVVPLTVLTASCDASTGPSGVTLPKMSCCTSLWSSGPKECIGTINGAVNITWCWHLFSGITKCNTNTSGIMWCQRWCQWHHMTKETVIAPHFSCLDLWNRMLTLMILLTGCDTYASVNGIKGPKYHVTPHFNFLDLKSAMVWDAINNANFTPYFDYLD